MTSTPFEKGSLLEGEVTSLAFGGQGIMKEGGFVTFVPYTAPGDVAIVKLDKIKKSFAEATLETLLTSSPQRVTPRCPYFGECGGCQLQHINYLAELEAKRKSVADTLQRVGKFSFPEFEIEAILESEWFYRERIALHLNHEKIGYIAKDNISILEIDQCVIFTDPDTEVFTELKIFQKQLKGIGRVDILKDDDKFIAYFRLEFPYYLDFKKLENLLKWSQEHLESFSGIHVMQDREVRGWGRFEIEKQVKNLHITYNPKVFIQNNQGVSLKITETLTSWLDSTRGAKLLDLYCGIGISSLLLAKAGFDVVAVESNKESIRLAGINKSKNQINNVRFFDKRVEHFLPEIIKSEMFDVALVNPPREGLLPEVVDALNRARLKEIIYLSCMPSTLARDCQKLMAEGFEVKKVMAFDMFPKTGHVETLLHLVRA